MPCILKVHVEAARGLPAIDKTSDLADAYVEIRFADADIQRTSVCRKTLNPIWNEDFRFEISDDTLLQDEPLELKVYDFDAITADDSIGTVTVDMNPLLSPDAPNQLAGWFPIYDTIRGARGELWLQVKLEFFENTNPFKDSSEGVHIFANAGISPPYTNATIVGLVDAVITEIDPDYHWSDSFRTSRSSNEASQRILNQMSCRLRRQMGRKALEMGGNSILGYCQWIDIEPYAQTITVRGLGTAAIMRPPEKEGSRELDSHQQMGDLIIKLHSQEIELATISKIPSGSIIAIGGIVSAKSVKLMSEEPNYSLAQTRDKWLSELREEMKTHVRNLGCNIVLGYQENISIHDDLYVVYAEGTACRIRHRNAKKFMYVDRMEPSSADESHDGHIVTLKSKLAAKKFGRARDCQFCHLPKRRSRLNEDDGDLVRCNVCRRSFVSDLLLATVEVPSDAEVFGDTRLVESYVCRPIRKKKESDMAAYLVSTNLPFVEYELYRQLQFKIRYNGFNAVFGLHYQFIATDKTIIAIASGTGVCLAALPKAKALQISRNIAIRDVEDKEIFDLQKKIAEISLEKHDLIERMYADRFPSEPDTSSSPEGTVFSSSLSSGSSSSSDDGSDSDRQSIVQIDDEADEDLLLTMVDPHTHGRVDYVGTSDTLPLLDVSHRSSPASSIVPLSQIICQFRRFTLNLDDHHPSFALSYQFGRQYDEIATQLHDVYVETPVITCIRHQINIVRGLEVQIVTTGTVIGRVQRTVKTVQQLLEPLTPSDIQLDFSMDDSDSDNDSMTEEQRQNFLNQEIDKKQQFVHFATCSKIPSNVFSSNCGTVTLQLFKEIHYHECSGGFSGFVSSVISDLFAMARASAASLGGNVLTSISFKPATFYENFKNQLHAVVSLIADVVNVDFDYPDSWTLIQMK